MFTLKKRVQGIRSGVLKNNGRMASTPCFFATNNFGGGGTNVARLYLYSDLMVGTNIQLLLNYYYIDINSDLKNRFDTGLVRQFSAMKDIRDLFPVIKKTYIERERIDLPRKYSVSESPWRPLILLDSGSGNILRDLIQKHKITQQTYRQQYVDIVDNFLSFIETHEFDVGIAIDFAKKNTLKDGEMKDKNYLNELTFYCSRNFELLDVTLQQIKQKYSKINLFVPLHGDSVEEYVGYLKKVHQLEEKENVWFAGFAIGGLGNPKIINGERWGIPSGVNARVKGALYLYKLCSAIRRELDAQNDDRPIHVLGAASQYNLLPLIVAGVDTFDCHSTWRRASDGNEASKQIVLQSIKKGAEDVSISTDKSISKMLVPLLDKKGEPIAANADNYLEFVDLHKLSPRNFSCNCRVCEKFSLNAIKELYSGTPEENYFAKILIYIHGIVQYELICDRLSRIKSGVEITSFIKSIPNSRYSTDMAQFLSYSVKVF